MDGGECRCIVAYRTTVPAAAAALAASSGKPMQRQTPPVERQRRIVSSAWDSLSRAVGRSLCTSSVYLLGTCLCKIRCSFAWVGANWHTFIDSFHKIWADIEELAYITGNCGILLEVDGN